jgi:hypothetical protein
MSAKSWAVLTLTLIDLSLVAIVGLEKATFSEILPVLTGTTGTIGGLITDVDSVVNKLKTSVKKGKQNGTI